jgi:tetratricopeptide (TPR) repeat protein
MDEIKIGKNGIPYNEIIKEGKLSYTDYVSSAYSAITIEDFELAMNFADEAILLKPKEPKAYGAKGIVYLQSGDKENALKYFQIAIGIFRDMQNILGKNRDDDKLRRIQEYDFNELIRDSEQQSTFWWTVMNTTITYIEHFTKLSNNAKN